MTVGVFQFHSPMEVGGAAVMRVALAHLVLSRYSGLQVLSAPASMAKLGVTPGWQKLEKRALSLSPFSPAQAIQLFSWSFNSLYCQLHNGTNSQPPPTHTHRERDMQSSPSAARSSTCLSVHFPLLTSLGKSSYIVSGANIPEQHTIKNSLLLHVEPYLLYRLNNREADKEFAGG